MKALEATPSRHLLGACGASRGIRSAKSILPFPYPVDCECLSDAEVPKDA